jgi:hypothetical protein
MITLGTSEREVPGSVVPGVPGGTPEHTPESASQAGIMRPKKQGPDASNFGRLRLYDRSQTIFLSGEEKKPQMKLGNPPLGSFFLLFQ